MSNAHTSTLSVNSAKIRDPYFDNARGLLIILVVAGHALLEIGGVYSRYLADFFYTFHMPAFILIAGYFSRSYAATPAQNRRLISGIAAPYLIFFVLHEVFSTFKRGSFVFPDFFSPRWTLWFLMALFVWRLLVPVFRQLRFPLAFAIAVGLFSPISDALSGEFSTGRILQYLPFFIAGTLITPEMVSRWKTLLSPFTRSLGVFVLLGLAIINTWLLRSDVLTHSMLISRSSYEALEQSVPEGVFWRAVILLMGVVGTLAGLLITPQSRSYLSTMGEKSLYIYLLHGLVLWPLRYTDIAPEWLSTAPGTVVTALACVILAMALASPPVTSLVRPLVEPRIDWLLTRPQHTEPPAQPAPGSPTAGSTAAGHRP